MTMPIKSATFDRVIRAVAAVRTRGGFAAWNLLLLAMTFGSLLLFGGVITTNQMWVLIVFFVCWQGFAVFALLKLPESETREVEMPASSEVTPKANNTLFMFEHSDWFKPFIEGYYLAEIASGKNKGSLRG